MSRRPRVVDPNSWTALASRLRDRDVGSSDPGLGAAHVALWLWRECGCGRVFFGFRGACAQCRTGWSVVRDDEPKKGGQVNADPRFPSGGYGAAPDPGYRLAPATTNAEEASETNRPLVADVAGFEADLRSGTTVEDVSRRRGVSVQQIRKWCEHHHVPAPRSEHETQAEYDRRTAAQRARRQRERGEAQPATPPARLAVVEADDRGAAEKPPAPEPRGSSPSAPDPLAEAIVARKVQLERLARDVEAMEARMREINQEIAALETAAALVQKAG